MAVRDTLAHPSAAAPLGPAETARAVRKLGRFELRQLLGRSQCSMAWLVLDPRSGQELVLVMPRTQPADADALQAWLALARRASRTSHPNLAHAVEVGEEEHWPYIAYDRIAGPTLAEVATERHGEGGSATEVAGWMVQALSGLAFAHEAGLSHGDLQTYLLTLSDSGSLRVMGLAVAQATVLPSAAESAPGSASLSIDATTLRVQREAAERDVLALGLIAHGLLVGPPALDEPDIGRAIARLPPTGREAVRLPWALPRPLPEALRAIVNRATERQPRQRYRNARTLIRALEGWLESESQQDGDAHGRLVERVRQIGVLPALPGGAARAARLVLMEREHTDELASIVLHDLALAFELLRVVNTASVRGSQVAGNGPVLTARRAIAMIGLDGVRRAALGLRTWPGPLDAEGARDLERALLQCKRAARVAQSLRPAGYDAEVVYLTTLLQNLGRMVVQYHYPEEVRQMRRLMQRVPVVAPAPGVASGSDDGAGDEPGMSESAAAFAVLGADIEGMGIAVARHWGMDEAVLHMIRRLPLDVPVRQADHDDDVLRAVASAANEAMDAMSRPVAQAQTALERVAQRYARSLDITLRDVQAAVQRAMQDHAAVVDERDDDGQGDGSEASPR